MPKVVEPAAQNHFPTRICHYSPDLLPVFGGVAMNMTVPAGRLRVQRADSSFLHTVLEKSGTIWAERLFITPTLLQQLRQNPFPGSFSVVMCMAEQLNKAGKGLQILYLFPGQFVHACHLTLLSLLPG